MKPLLRMVVGLPIWLALILIAVACSPPNITPTKPPPASTQKLVMLPGAFQVKQSGGPPSCCQHASYMVRDKPERVLAFYDDLANKDDWYTETILDANERRYIWGDSSSINTYVLTVVVTGTNGVTAVDVTLGAQAPL